MTTAFKSILDTVRAALMAAPAVAGGRIAYGRDDATPLGAASDVTLTLQAQDGEPIALVGAPTDWTALLGVEVRARASASQDAWTAIDPYIEQVYQRLAAIDWPAGVTGVTGLRGRLDPAEAATAVASWQFVLTINFRTAPRTLALAP